MTTMSTSPHARRLAWSAAIGWMTVIFGASSLPGTALPSSGAAPYAHFGAYAVLGLLLYMAILHDVPEPRRAFVLAVLFASAYGVTDELHQAFVPGRTPDVADWGIDTLGALCGAAMTRYAIERIARATPAARPRR